MVFNKILKNQSTQINQTKTIRIIGDRGAGKTAYITALACLPWDDIDSPVKRVVPIGSETEDLVRKAQELLEQKLEIEPNVYGEGIERSYVFKIEFKARNPLFSSNSNFSLDIQCKDYPGEFFSDLVERKKPNLLERYIKDCVEEATGILLLLDGTARKDKYYAECIKELLIQLDRLSPRNTQPRRVAVALTKCDMSELWIHRQNPREKIMARFEAVHGKLQNTNSIIVDYFATSAYGMLGNENETSNSKIVKSDDNGTRAVIREPDSRLWRPFGIVEPIYWLYTGRRYSS